MYSSVIEKCEHGYSPLDLRGSHLVDDSDSDINVESDDDMVHVSTRHSGEFDDQNQSKIIRYLLKV